jgi:hypothetical protein
MGDSARNPLVDERGAAASRVGQIAHHWGQEPAKEELHTEAEPLLIEGYGQMNPLPASANRKQQALERIIKLCKAWHAAEPGQGYAEKATEWRAKPPTTQPAHEPAVCDADEGSL